MLTINIITLFPSVFGPFFELLPYKRAIDKNLIKLNIINLRDYAIDERGTVDDKPFGGGVGMVLMIEPLYKALADLYKKTDGNQNKKLLVMTPKGESFDHEASVELSKADHITIICGRYEGIDERILKVNELLNIDNLDVKEVSIGNYVLSGGEVPALAVLESMIRQIPGAIENSEALETESHKNKKLEHPQYTKPRDFKGLKVPEVLFSGDHKKIADWKKSTMVTMEKSN